MILLYSSTVQLKSLYIQSNPLRTEEFVQFRQVFGLHRLKLRRHLVDWTVKSFLFRQVDGLLRVQ